MRLLIDSNNFFLRHFFSKIINPNSPVPEWDLFKFITVDHVINYIYKFKATEVIFAIDSPDTWRKILYPNYKYSRKLNREKSEVDWNKFFEVYNEYLAEIQEHLPFKVLKIKGSEADDVIGILAESPSVIISSDSDFNQMITKSIKVFNPFTQKYVEKIDNFVNIACLQGQKKDDIPNILTPLDWDITSKVRRPIFGEKKAQKIIAEGLEPWLQENSLEKRFQIQKTLIDLSSIPKTIEKRIVDAYSTYKMPEPENIGKFFMKYNWRSYMEKLSEVENRLMQLY